jgi:hypothetical protein
VKLQDVTSGSSALTEVQTVDESSKKNVGLVVVDAAKSVVAAIAKPGKLMIISLLGLLFLTMSLNFLVLKMAKEADSK